MFGACTAAARSAGQKTREAIQRRIDHGSGSDSELDYNFTDCRFAGPEIGPIDKVGDRDVALLIDTTIGAHDIANDRFRLALEICGKLYVTGTFGETYTGRWSSDDLTIRERADRRQIIVDGRSVPFRGVLFRLTLPACGATPVEQVLDAE